MKTVDEMIDYLSRETEMARDMLNAGKLDDAVRRAELAMQRLAEMLSDTVSDA